MGWISRLASHLLGGAQGQLAVGAVHRVAGLEGDHPAPALAGELGAQLGRRLAQGAEVVVDGELHPLQAAADGDRVGLLEQVGDAGVLGVGGAEGRLGARLAVGLPDLLDVQGGEHHAFGVAQREHASARRAACRRNSRGDVEQDRDRPQGAVGQAHALADGVVVGLAHEAGRAARSRR